MECVNTSSCIFTNPFCWIHCELNWICTCVSMHVTKEFVWWKYLNESQVYIPKRRTLIQVLPPANAYTKPFATCLCIYMQLDLYAWCTHWLSNCNSEAKCIYAWADNIGIWGEEVPVWVSTFWVCKPVNKDPLIIQPNQMSQGQNSIGEDSWTTMKPARFLWSYPYKEMERSKEDITD